MADRINAKNTKSLDYPLGKFNFMVTVSTPGADGTPGTPSIAKAAFSEVSGLDTTVEVVEFRQGNAHSLSPLKLPGLVKHGNVTLKMGYTIGSDFKTWVKECLDNPRKAINRRSITIELYDTNLAMPEKARNATGSTDCKDVTWVLNDAWVCKYNGPDLNAMSSEVAIESVEIAYETLTIPN